MTILERSWEKGLEPFLCYGALNVHRIDRKPMTEADLTFIKINKEQLIAKITSDHCRYRISGEDFYGPGLMADAAERAKRRNNHE